jgi:hypothetical protein
MMNVSFDNVNVKRSPPGAPVPAARRLRGRAGCSGAPVSNRHASGHQAETRFTLFAGMTPKKSLKKCWP